MKKIFILFIAMLFSAAISAQEKRVYLMKNDTVCYRYEVSDIDSIIFYKPYIAVKSISLNETSIVVDDEHTLTATIMPGEATNQTITWTSSKNSVANVDENGKVTAITNGISIITAKVEDKTATCVVRVVESKIHLIHDEGVLINGKKWATRNVDTPGTFTVNPEDAGMFYQWNSKTGWSATNPLTPFDEMSTWNNYSWNGSTSWQVINDPCPAGWRVPTYAEIYTTLYSSSVERVWTIKNGKNGYLFGSDDNTIFLPAAGRRLYTDSTLQSPDTSGYYWSSVIISPYTYYLFFSKNNFGTDGTSSRGFGFSVRCVADE